MDDISSAVEKALNGDKNAFERLYNLTSKGVYFTCRSFVSNESDIKDIMQETYLTAFQKLSTLNGRSKFQAWVNRIAANKCKNFLVKPADLSLENEIEEGFQPEDEQNILPEEYITDTEKRRMIMNIVRNALPPEQYQTIILFYFDEMSISDIAEIMGCPEGTVKFRLHAARTKIKREVLSYEEKNDDRLHSIVGIPFFTRLFRAEAESVRAPYNYSDLSASLENAITDSTAKQGKAGSAINRGGKRC